MRNSGFFCIFARKIKFDTTMSGKSFLYGLVAGALIGGTAALLLSPKTGEENLQDLKRKLNEFMNENGEAPSNDEAPSHKKEKKDGE